MAELALPPNLPEAYWQRVAAQLGPEAEAYRAALAEPAPVSIRVNPARSSAPLEVLAGTTPLSVPGAYRLPERRAFILDPAWHAGAYYVQEASSMHVAEALRPHLPPRPLRALDRCAAPGGKATHLASLLPPGSLLVACEPVAARRSILVENLTRWGVADAVVQGAPQGWAEGAFDVIVVDAPCSGEGLFRKQPEAVNEWSEAAVSACAARQADILDQTLPLLAPGGLLAYSTCTAAPAENGAQIARLLSRHPELSSVPLPTLEALGWVAQPEGGYQAWPHRVVGEGLYLCLLRRAGAPQPLSPARRWPADLSPALAGSLGALEPALWLAQPTRWQALLHRGQAVVLSADALQLLREGLGEPEAFGAGLLGLALGERKGADALPDHALALSPHHRADLPTLALSREAALRYLKREAFAPEAAPTQAGWHLATHQGLPLGWVKAIAGGRLNNYLPPSWRIRRDLPPEA